MSRIFNCLLLITLLFSVVTTASEPPGKGYILFEYFYNQVWAFRDPWEFPPYPDDSEWWDSFEGRRNWGDYYVTRVRGYLYPPETGEYTFWVAADWHCRLYLSTDDTPANAVQIAYVFEGYGGWHEWDVYPSQQSEPIMLEAGKRYYIEGIQTEYSGDDHFSVAWQGPGIPEREVIEGQYLSPLIRDVDLKAKDPHPADGVIYEQTWANLSWSAGTYAVSHDVYFGENFDDVNEAAPDTFRGNVSETYFIVGLPEYPYPEGLVRGTTYYWRVDEVESDGEIVHIGDVWSFTVQPYTAHSPNPRDGAKWIPVDVTVEWGSGKEALSHDVYFGADKAAVEAGASGTFKGNQKSSQYEPAGLQKETTYYWRIDEHASGGELHKGQVWSFKTISSLVGIKGEYFEGMHFLGEPVMTRIDPEINFTWQRGDVAPIDIPMGDWFSVRWAGELEVQATEPYTFYIFAWHARVYVDDRLIIDASWNETGSEMHSAPILLAGDRLHSIVVEYFDRATVAQCELRWSSPSTPKQIIPSGPLQVPVRAVAPRPHNGEINVEHAPKLEWMAGEGAVRHDVYFGPNEAAVAEANIATPGIFKARQAENATSYLPGTLEWEKTYYWRVDEVNTVNPEKPCKGLVWSFTTADYCVIDDFESYTEYTPNQIYQTWIDGWGYKTPPGHPGNGTGSTVGHYEPPYVETMWSFVHGGAQSMPFKYLNDGITGKLFYSETQRTFATPQDWTANAVKALTLWFLGSEWGRSTGSYSYDLASDTHSVGYCRNPAAGDWGSGAGIRGDNVYFVYKVLSGDGSIIARIESIQDINEPPTTQATGIAGVMIRESMEWDSAFSFMCLSSDNRRVFQNQSRDKLWLSAYSEPNAIALPCWVKLERDDNRFTGFYSEDGQTWIKQPVDEHPTNTNCSENPQSVPMWRDVYIGLAVTGQRYEFERPYWQAILSNVTTTGMVTGQWKGQDVPCNIPETLYVAVEDSAGSVKAVDHPDPDAVVQKSWGWPPVQDWQQWDIPLKAFSDADVNLKSVKKMYLGVGSRDNPEQGGSGKLWFDDIRLYRSRCVPSMAKPAADLTGDCLVNHLDLEIMAEQWLKTIPSQTAFSADLNADKKVDLKDYARMASAWLEQILWP